MSFGRISEQGLVLLGCGKMGSAMLAGWIEAGLPPSAVRVIEPHPSEWLQSIDGLALNAGLSPRPAVIVLAVKPQMMGDALPAVTEAAGPDTVILSIAAGTPIARFEDVFGAGARIVRAMPNTPAAIGKGITALVGNTAATREDLVLAETLLAAIGQTVRLEREDDIDAVTGVSGSGPAYVFHMIEALAAAGETEGLAADLAMKLAVATVEGAGALAARSDATPGELRKNVTSPNGTTQAGLEVLMNEDSGLKDLIEKTVQAAAARSRELRE